MTVEYRRFDAVGVDYIWWDGMTIISDTVLNLSSHFPENNDWVERMPLNAVYYSLHLMNLISYQFMTSLLKNCHKFKNNMYINEKKR